MVLADTLVVTRLDRLGRSLAQVLASLQAISDAGATFRVLDNAALDTTTAQGQLLIGILGALAQFERTLILSRTREGRARYVANGGKLGRKPKLSAFQIQQAKVLRDQGQSLTEIGRLLGTAHSTVSRSLRNDP